MSAERREGVHPNYQQIVEQAFSKMGTELQPKQADVVAIAQVLDQNPSPCFDLRQLDNPQLRQVIASAEYFKITPVFGEKFVQKCYRLYYAREDLNSYLRGRMKEAGEILGNHNYWQFPEPEVQQATQSNK